MKMKAAVLLVATLFMMSAVIIAIPQSNVSADSGFSVEDGQGNEIEYDAPSGKVVTIGKGLTATVIQLGYLDKIIVCDKYSYSATEEVFNDLKGLVDERKILADGSAYSTGITDVFNNIVYATEEMGFDMKKDTVLLTGTLAQIDDLKSRLVAEGYEKILMWTTIETYDDLVDYVETVSKVVSGEIADLAKQMSYVQELIADTLESEGVSESEKVKAFFVTYSSSAFRVGNTGSLAISMISAAGGNPVTVDDSKGKPTYPETLTDIVNTHGTDTVVFMDYSITNSPTNLKNIKDLLPGVELVPLDSLWNNFCPASMDGVWTMASAMYPEYFEGDVPTLPDDDPDNLLLYVAAAVAVIAVIGVAAYFLMRKS